MADDNRMRDIVFSLNEIFSGACFTDNEFEYLNVVRKSINLLSESQKEDLYEYLIKISSPDNSITIASFIYDIYKDDSSLKKMVECFNYPKSLNEFYEIYWNITRRMFVRSDVNPTIQNEFSEKTRKIFLDVFNSVKMSNLVKQINYKKKISIEKVIIISPQILGMAHSPTREAFNIACHLKRNHRCKVSIVNCNSMNFHNTLRFFNPSVANLAQDFNGLQNITVNYLDFKDIDIELFTLDGTLMSVKKINQFIDFLNQVEPDAIITHGPNLIFQELVYKKIPSLFATTGTTVPIEHSDAYWIPGNLLSESREKQAAIWGHYDFMRETMIVTPADSAEAPLQKKLFGFEENAFLFLVAGTRLNNEIQVDFVEFCAKLTDNCPDAKVVFAGSTDLDVAHFFGHLPDFQKKFINVGIIQDFSAFCLMCNVFINPKRQGGGTSAQTAMMNHLPIVTMNYGHISATVPEKYRHADYQQMLSYAIKLYEDQEFLEQEKNHFYTHFVTTLKTDEQVSKMFNKLLEIQSRYPS